MTLLKRASNLASKRPPVDRQLRETRKMEKIMITRVNQRASIGASALRWETPGKSPGICVITVIDPQRFS
jgi:hypothetical protein